MPVNVTPGLSPYFAGQSFEDLLDFAHQMYWNRDRVWVRHNGIKGVFRSRGKGQKAFTPHPDKGAPDYYGCINGHMVAFDAKSTQNKTRWKLHSKSKHQYERLLDIASAGGTCWFAIERRLTNMLYLLRVRPSNPVLDRMPVIKFDDFDLRDNLLIDQVEGWYDWLKPVLVKWVQT